VQDPVAFQHLLAWLDEGVDSHGERYLQMRRRLALYFDRKRARSPDELADETLNRVSRRLEEQGSIADTPPARYCYIVARFVFLEYARQERGRTTTSELVVAAPANEAADEREKLFACLERCLKRLDAGDRSLILDYYVGEQRAKLDQRRRIADRLHLTSNALSIRACRIRNRLEDCVLACANRP
jgi:DNA-directed RNA polymerase specialized sigma24 family protein